MKTVAILLAALLSLPAASAAAEFPTAKPSDYFWPGAYATYFWVDPKLDLVVVSMLQPPLGRHYNPLMRSLVHQAIAE
jgi:CubicO group peptidase (beta-lactamase class C family)